ncbi:MAG TPA: hypothetical protein PLK08_01995, partial [Phycisphaerae bacterium]|nr:hypothetical protein [Phycisphaerae bacterium]
MIVRELIVVVVLIAGAIISCKNTTGYEKESTMNTPEMTVKIGWGQADITPSMPVLIAGQFCARVSESVLDPITITAMAIEGEDQAVMVSCDLVCIPDELRDEVRSRLKKAANGVDPMKVVFNATHTHTAPEMRVDIK